jgi:hypothetical protein
MLAAARQNGWTYLLPPLTFAKQDEREKSREKERKWGEGVDCLMPPIHQSPYWIMGFPSRESFTTRFFLVLCLRKKDMAS